MRDLASRERPDFDGRGFPARRGEVVSANLSNSDVNRARAQGFTVIEDVNLKSLGLRMVRLRAPEGMAASDAVKALRTDQDDGAYDYDHYYGVSGEQHSPGASKVEVRQRTAPAPRKALWIGMIDTAVKPHPALRSVSIDSQNFSASPNAVDAAPSAHGTAVASVLAQQGVRRVTSANIFSSDARPFASADGIAKAIDWMVGRGVPVINISIAGPSNMLVSRVIAAATAKGHLIVAAAGNGGPMALPAYPAASPGAIAVTAVDGDGQVYLHANRGPYVTIAALGVGIPAAAPDGTMKPYSGTSFAAPVVAAHLANCMTKSNASRAKTCVLQMEASARDAGAPGRDPVYGYGVLTP